MDFRGLLGLPTAARFALGSALGESQSEPMLTLRDDFRRNSGWCDAIGGELGKVIQLNAFGLASNIWTK